MGWAVLDLALAFAVGAVIGLLVSALAAGKRPAEPVEQDDL